jgi:thioredoxin 1
MIKVTRFTADWCSPCRALAPIIEQIKETNTDVVFETIDIDDNPGFVSMYNIKGIPVILIEKDGKEVNRFVGIQPKIVYETAIHNHKEN